jgi:predicted RNA binding protein YcfA (HicA-like mRNA interferase family)
LNARDLIRALERIGYVFQRQRGSHMTLTHPGPPEHSITVPMHDPLRVGTLNSILKQVSPHLKLTRDELLERLFS